MVANIPAAAASDGTNNSLASTSTDNSVTFDLAAPAVTINQGVGKSDPTTVSPVVCSDHAIGGSPDAIEGDVVYM